MHLSKTKFWHASTIVDICLICPCPTITPSDTRPNKVHAELKEASRWVATESVRWGRLGGSWILSLFMLRIDKFSWSSYGIREQGIHIYRKNKETRVCSMNHEICGWSVFRIIFNATRRFQASCRFLWKKTWQHILQETQANRQTQSFSRLWSKSCMTRLTKSRLLNWMGGDLLLLTWDLKKTLQ